MLQRVFAHLFAVTFATATLVAGDGSAPRTFAIGGGEELPLAGQARRTLLLGAVDAYTIAVYATGATLDRGHLASPDVAKAIRLEATYEDDLRRPPVVDWRFELVPTVDRPQAAHLRGTFAPLRRGDIVAVEYAPSRGTTVLVNRAVAVSGGHHDLMLAFLDHWLGQRPVSEEMKRTLLGSS
jgi:hypothetical protein